ncbi:MAG: ABC transporter permease [Vicinamibacterales bacterium]
MTAWSLAWRTIARSPARSVLAVAGVTVIGALLFDMLLLSRGLLVSFRDLLDTAGFDIRVVAAEGSMVHRPPIAQAATLAEAIARLPDVQRVTRVRTETAQAIAPRTDAGIRVTLVGTTAAAAGTVWTIVSGSSLPAESSSGDPPPVVVSPSLATELHLEVGSTLGLRLFVPGAASALPAINARVIGIGQFAFEAAGDDTVATTMEGLAAARGMPSDGMAEMVLVSSRPGTAVSVAAAIARLRPDLRVLSNDQVMEQFNQNAFSYFRQISTVLSSMTLAFAFLLIATLLTMSVNQRLGEVAALRALGFPRRRIAANLLWESVLLVGVGGVAALPVGGVLAIILDRILREMPGVPARLHFFVFEPRTIVLHAALLSITGMLAAVYPIWLATRLPIAATLRREILS